MDDDCNNLKFINNTVVGCTGSAIFFHNNQNIYVEGNLLSG